MVENSHLDVAIACRMHTARLPPDLLWLEWFQGRRPETWDAVRGHPLYVYHRNLLDHIGALSSFAVRPERLPFPRCFDSMATVWSIHTKERFNVSHPSARRCYNLLCAAGSTTACPGPWVQACTLTCVVHIHCKRCHTEVSSLC